MKNNAFLRILASMPIILITLYFIPFLGVCLIIFRYIMYYNNRKKRNNTPIFLIITGILIFIPNILKSVFNLIQIETSKIPYFELVANSEIYIKNFIKLGKTVITLGVISTIISFILNKIFEKTSSFVRNYINEQERQDREISEKNDLIMKEKQEIAKNTQVVNCPYCGADNMLTSSVGTCKYCRRKIGTKN